MGQVRIQEKILLVDDEPDLLLALRRNLGDSFNIQLATSGPEAMDYLVAPEPIAVLVSDLRMPGMDGIELLKKARSVSPDTVRMMLTGYADLQASMAAVNDGNVFRFLAKPCRSEDLKRSLVEGIRQYRLARAERELLEGTLNSTLKVFSDLLSVVKPEAFGRSARIASWATKLAQAMDLENIWEVSVAASLCQLGLIALPDALIAKVSKGRTLTAAQTALYDRHPETTAQLVAAIPRLEKVAEIIAFQEKHYDGSGPPDERRKGADIPMGARILKVAIDFETLVSGGRYRGEAYREMQNRPGFYDPAVFAALSRILGAEKKFTLRELSVHELKPYMILGQDVYSEKPSRLLMAKGQELSDALIAYLRKYQRSSGVVQPIKAVCPLWLR